MSIKGTTLIMNKSERIQKKKWTTRQQENNHWFQFKKILKGKT